MKKSTEAEYQEWVKEIKSTLPEEKRRLSFEQLLSDPAGQEVFGGHLREADYYRRLNDVTAKKGEAEQAALVLASERTQFEQDVAGIDEWFKREEPKNRQLLAERSALQTEIAHYQERFKDLGLDDEVRRTPSVEANKVSKSDNELREEIEKLKTEHQRQMNAMDQATVKVLRDYGSVMHKINKEGFDIDPGKLIDYSTQNRVDLNTAYTTLTADQKTKRDAESAEKLKEQYKEEGRREALSKLPSPDRIRPTAPSVVDKLLEGNGSQAVDSRGRVDAAVSSWLKDPKASFGI